MRTGEKAKWGCLALLVATVLAIFLPAFQKARWSVVVAPTVRNDCSGPVEVVGIASGGRVRKGSVGPGESRKVRLVAGDTTEPITIVVTAPSGRADEAFAWSRVVPEDEVDIESIVVHADGSVELKRRPER